MNEAGRGKKAIFDQDSNPWVPWDPTKKIIIKIEAKVPLKSSCAATARTMKK